MSTHDKSGREYAKLSELKGGTMIELDEGFTCHKAGPVMVQGASGEGGLYFRCDAGLHFLDGQLAKDGDHLVGVYPVT